MQPGFVADDAAGPSAGRETPPVTETSVPATTTAAVAETTPAAAGVSQSAAPSVAGDTVCSDSDGFECRKYEVHEDHSRWNQEAEVGNVSVFFCNWGLSVFFCKMRFANK